MKSRNYDDLPCPQCGYDLRAATDDPVRCSECGETTTREVLRCHPRAIARRHRVMVAALTWCSVVPCSAVILPNSVSAMVSASAAVLLWGLGLFAYGNSSEFSRGFVGRLIYHNAAGIAIFLVAITIASIALPPSWPRRPSPIPGWLALTMMLMVGTGACLWYFAAINGIHRAARHAEWLRHHSRRTR